MKYNYNLFTFFISSFCFVLISSCNLYNPAEPIPAYIHIDKINLTTNFSAQGTNSAKISDAWVYVDEQLIGCFELPATIPMLYSGNHQVKIRPGIKVNGISATRSPYPFYTIYKKTFNLQKGLYFTLNPTVTYLTSTHFQFKESFENIGMSIDVSPAAGVDDTLIKVSSPNLVFEGTGAGYAHLDKTHTFFECVSNTSYCTQNVPTCLIPPLYFNGAPIFLEFNYKCNHEFVAGVYAHNNVSSGSVQAAALTFNPSDTWNKAYLYLSPVIDANYTATDFSIFFGMQNYENADSLYMLLDNIKLVY
jgi:hypothetical protein